MREQTYELATMEEVFGKSEAEQKRWHPIPDDDIERMKGANRAERRAWMKRQKRKARNLKSLEKKEARG